MSVIVIIGRCAWIVLAPHALHQAARHAESVEIQSVAKVHIARKTFRENMPNAGSKTLLKRLLSAVLLVNTPLVSDVGKKCLLVPEIARKMQRIGCVWAVQSQG